MAWDWPSITTRASGHVRAAGPGDRPRPACQAGTVDASWLLLGRLVESRGDLPLGHHPPRVDPLVADRGDVHDAEAVLDRGKPRRRRGVRADDDVVAGG